ncbi:MAG: pyridoxamine 5'-phosphate oxidase family protein, partial [Candidatus Eisenbacteria bacterium]|nr:pyridoxamine 5'-phosphate oxidase family protein [Candidatus Eisenbacteria bacterium]
MALDTRDHARGMARLLREQRFAVLATQESNAPYVSLVAFAASPDLRLVYFATLGATRKGRALDSSPCVAMLVDDRRNDLCDLEHATALTLTGVATR